MEKTEGVNQIIFILEIGNLIDELHRKLKSLEKDSPNVIGFVSDEDLVEVKDILKNAMRKIYDTTPRSKTEITKVIMDKIMDIAKGK